MQILREEKSVFWLVMLMILMVAGWSLGISSANRDSDDRHATLSVQADWR